MPSYHSDGEEKLWKKAFVGTLLYGTKLYASAMSDIKIILNIIRRLMCVEDWTLFVASVVVLRWKLTK